MVDKDVHVVCEDTVAHTIPAEQHKASVHAHIDGVSFIGRRSVHRSQRKVTAAQQLRWCMCLCLCLWRRVRGENGDRSFESAGDRAAEDRASCQQLHREHSVLPKHVSGLPE